MPQGLVRFPGILRPIRASFTISHGITPSVCTIDIMPQRDFSAQSGNLVFSYADQVMTFKDCIVTDANIRRDQSGIITGVQILDRRWKWRFGAIFGCYNTRRANETINPNRIKTAQELATLCLEAMGEQGFDVSGLDNQLRPEVDWQGAVPAECLQQLCDQLDARVVLGLDDKVKLCKNGQGGDLPVLPSIASDSYTFDPPEKPDKIELWSAPIVIQTYFMLEAIGKEPSGVIKPIDKLSYKPSSGWNGSTGDIEQWLDLPNEKHQELAKECVFKWYRIKGFGDGNWNFPGRTTPATLDEVLPICDTLIDTYIDPPTGLPVQQPAYVWGLYQKWSDAGDKIENCQLDPAFSKYEGTFTIDRERGIVMFDEPVVFWNEEGTRHYVPPSDQESFDAFVSPAKLWLLATFSLPVPSRHDLQRYRLEKSLGGNLGTQPETIVRDDLVYTIRMNYTPDGGSGATSSSSGAGGGGATGYTFQGMQTNEQEYKAEAQPVLDAAAARYQTVTPQTRQYNGLVKVTLDGAIQQVTYVVGVDSGAVTTVSRGTESNPIVPTLKERRVLEKLTNEIFKKAAPTENQLRKSASRRMT